MWEAVKTLKSRMDANSEAMVKERKNWKEVEASASIYVICRCMSAPRLMIHLRVLLCHPRLSEDAWLLVWE